MSAANAIRAGAAYIELFTRDTKLTRGLAAAEARIKAWGDNISAIGGKLFAGGVALFAPMAAAVKTTSDLNETMSKFGAVFGDRVDDATVWMERFTTTVGRSKKDIADALSAYQAFFSGLGIGSAEAQGMSQELTGLAVDFASFHNLSDPEAIQRFISALSGSGEVLDMFGVNIKAAALDQKLLAMGFPKVTEGATEVQKVMARMAIIRESMGRQGAVGDAIRTSSSFSNQLKATSADVWTLTNAVGEGAMPVFAEWLAAVRDAVQAAAEWVVQNQELVQTTIKVGAAVLGFGAASFVLGEAMELVANTTATVGYGISAIGWVAKNSAPLVAALFTPFGAVVGIVAAIAAVTAGFALFGSTVGEVSREMQTLADKNKKVRGDDDVRLQRLEQLAEKQRLSNDENKEATAIIDLLQSRYGKLGASIDQTTGKLNGMAIAQNRVNNAMAKQAAADLAKQISEAERNVESLQAKADTFTTSSPWQALPGTNGTMWQGRESREKEQSKANEDLRNESARLKALQALRDAGKAGPDDVADTKAKINAEQMGRKAIADKAEKSAERLAKMDEERRLKNMEALKREIAEIQKAGEERKKLLADVITGEKNRKEGARSEKLAELESRAAQIDGEVAADVAAATEKHDAETGKKTADDEAEKQRRKEDADRGLRGDVARLQDETFFADRPGQDEKTRRILEQQRREAQIERERKEALAEAERTGVGDVGLINKKFDLQDRLADLEFEAQEADRLAQQKVQSAGTFSARAVGVLGGDNVQKKIADATAATAAGVKKLVEKKPVEGAVFL